MTTATKGMVVYGVFQQDSDSWGESYLDSFSQVGMYARKTDAEARADEINNSIFENAFSNIYPEGSIGIPVEYDSAYTDIMTTLGTEGPSFMVEFTNKLPANIAQKVNEAISDPKLKDPADIVATACIAVVKEEGNSSVVQINEIILQ